MFTGQYLLQRNPVFQGVPVASARLEFVGITNEFDSLSFRSVAALPPGNYLNSVGGTRQSYTS